MVTQAVTTHKRPGADRNESLVEGSQQGSGSVALLLPTKYENVKQISIKLQNILRQLSL